VVVTAATKGEVDSNLTIIAEALAFYADQKNYDGWAHDEAGEVVSCDIWDDMGDMAREALLAFESLTNEVVALEEEGDKGCEDAPEETDAFRESRLL
jgi:hypothetical protein